MPHITLTLVACEKWFKKKNSFKINKNIFLSLFKNLFSSTLDTTIISKMSNTHWHPGKRCCIPLHEKNLSKFWLKFCLSQVTTQVARMSKCDCCVTCHTPGWIDWNGIVDPYPYPWYHVPTILHYLCETWTSTPKLGLQCLSVIAGRQAPALLIRWYHNYLI